jgi:glucan 1,3-beta-glucosidase
MANPSSLSLLGSTSSFPTLPYSQILTLLFLLVVRYFLKAIEWARKYGLRINLDFHSLPGSQNGWDHSGKKGTIGVLQGPMGIANAQRSLDYIRILAEFISQDQYKEVVTMFGVTNEPRQNTMDVLQS